MMQVNQARRTVLMFCVLWILLPGARGYGLEIAGGKLRVTAGLNNYIPYISNYPLEVANNKIQHVILAIHSFNHNAQMVYDRSMALLEKYNLTDSVLVIAPQFLMEKHIADMNSPNLVYWGVSPFWGSSVAKVTPEGADFRISAYTILENIISSLCEKKVFQNVESIVILGHSAGGQLVNRFAVSNTVEDEAAKPAGIKIKYVVMNPSSYVYFSPKRYVKGSKSRFAIPDANTLAEHPGYDNYGYGLKKLYAYHRHKGLTAEKIRQQYSRRNVVHMLGREDNVADSSMSKHPSAMLEGQNRLERGRIYYKHLLEEFGPQIKEHQKLVVIRNVGHSGRGMILSPMGAKNIIGGFIEKDRASKVDMKQSP